MNRLLKFKTFESNEETEFITQLDIKELFIELMDEGFEIIFYENKDETLSGIYFFEFTKKSSEGSYGHIDKNYAYGLTDILSIKKQFNFFDILDEVKERLNSMSYTIGFEMYFTLNTNLDFKIVCHLQHSKWDDISSTGEGDYDDQLEDGINEIEDDFDDYDEDELEDGYFEKG